MATLRPSKGDVAETSDDEGYQLMVEGASQQVDNRKASAMYLKRHGDEIHEALDNSVNPTIYSKNLGRMEIFKPPTPEVKEMLLWYSKENTDLPFDVLRCSWDDVFGQMARARGDHEAAVSRKGNLFKYLWRKAGSEKEAIKPWLELFPDEYGLSIVRGAIGIFFHMAEKTHQREKSILDGFETITDIIHSAMSKGIGYSNEPEMYACCQELQDSIIKGVADLIWSLKGEAKGKNMLEKFKNKHEKKKSINIEALVKKVQKKSIELDQCAERILAQKTIETNQKTSDLDRKANIAQELLTGVSQTQEYHLEITQETNASVKYLGAAANSLDFTVKQGLLKVQEIVSNNNSDRYRLTIAKEVQNAVMEGYARSEFSPRRPRYQQQSRGSSERPLTSPVFQEFSEHRHEMYLENQRLSQQIRAITPIPHEEVVYLPCLDLIEWMAVPFSLVTDDLRLVTTQSSQFSRQLQQQAQSSLLAEGFRHWVMSQDSELLLVDGNMPSTTRSAISPMSMLCTILPSSLNTMYGRENVIILHYFCSLHSSPSDPVSGPVGMMRTLVNDLAGSIVNMQNADRAEFAMGHLESTTQEQFFDDLQDYHIGALALALERLLRLVPSHIPVFCLIDGVSDFETRAYRDDLAYVVRKLNGIVARNGHVFKVFLTCPYRSTFLVRENFIDPRDHIVAEVGGRGGLGLMSERSVVNWSPR